jgi:regulator of sigma E protease
MSFLTRNRFLLLLVLAYLVFGLLTGSISGQTIGTVVLFVVILGVLVLVHELGHFFAARIANVRVLEFGVGFPPRARVLRAKGETVYTLNWLPIGGFVKLEGEDGDAADDPRSFSSQRLITKVLILAAGVVMNVVLAFAIFVGIAAFTDPAVGVTVPYVDPGSPADTAGLVVGDVVERVDGRYFGGFADSWTILDELRSKAGQSVTLTVRHTDGTTTTPTVTLRSASEISAGKGALGIGKQGAPVTAEALDARVEHSLGESIGIGASRTGWAMGIIVGGVKDLFVNAVTNPTQPPQASGPIGIAQTIGDVFWSAGIAATLYLVAILSANLAVVNILPFPPLDGGRILMILLKRVLGSRISLRAERLTYFVGFAVLFAFLIWVTAYDILRGLGGGG